MGGPELVAAVIQQPGKIPEILQAFRIVPSGKQPDLQAVKLRGKVLIDPNDDSVDLFTKIIEERKRSSSLGTERAHPVIDTSEDAHSTPATQAAGQMLIVGYTTNVFSLLSEVT